MTDFNIIDYIGTLIGYPIPRGVVERIILERGLSEITSWADVPLRDKNLAIADLLFYVFTMPSNTGSKSKSHGDFSVTIGGTIITDKNDLYTLMMRIYNNPEKELWENMSDIGNCSFIDCL